MRLFRVKERFTNGSGELRKGQVFLVANPIELPMPHGLDLLRGLEYYQEVTFKGPFGKIDLTKYISLAEAK
jgi:hypothetical protein